jgi:PAS domain S-box-containing protein
MQPAGITDLAAAFGKREEFYRTILDSLAEGLIITDHESRIVYANSRAEEITGYNRQELLGRISYEVLSPRKNWDKMRRRLRERLAGNEEGYEHELIRKDGTTIWIRVLGTPYRNASGEVAGTVGALSCISRQKILERENEYLRSEFDSHAGLDELIGPSEALARIRHQITMVAPSEANVLIYGESGTGKELVARAVHELSPRSKNPLIRVNCAAIPKDLFESEFFGHVRGAFTGAIKDRVGRFELADGGTLFLDEVGEIPLDLQSKLLRVIQERQFERIGEDRTRRVNVRLISATNRSLVEESAAGRFRSDLYYRLSVFPIEVPPLRDRREDIQPLAEHFLQQYARRSGMPVPPLTQAQRDELYRYDWPGNVRELQNVIERATILAPHGGFTLNLDAAPRQVVKREEQAIADALKHARGKIYGRNGAAALLGIKPTTLASKIARLGLDRRDFLNG